MVPDVSLDRDSQIIYQNKMKLSLSIMAHPSRKDFVDYLHGRLGNIPVSFDEGCGVWENCKRAWRLHDPDADFHCVIQDDAIICDDFHMLATLAIQTGWDKGCATSLFFGKRTPLINEARRGLKQGFIIKRMLHWGVAICLPTGLIEEMIAFGDKINIKQDDARISRFLQNKHIPIYYPLPSLVDHRHGVSLVNDPGRFRSAFKYIDENKSKD